MSIRYIIFVILFLCLPVVFAGAAEKISPSLAPTKLQARPEQKSNPSAKNITDTAVKAGVRACAGRINQVTDFLTTGLTSGAVFFQPPSNPDKSLVSFSLGLKVPAGKVAYASESFAPNQANGCGSTYETVVYWEAGCSDVAKLQFSSFRNDGVLVNSIMMLDKGTGVRVFLMPAGTGCVAIKKQVLN